MTEKLSVQALQRMPMYLSILKEKHREGATTISARSVASELGYGEIQVRKDLASVSNGGKPKIGYVISGLIADIEAALGYDDVNDAVLVGAGRLGRALLSYEGFNEYGLNIVAAFDTDETLVGKDENGKKILSASRLKDFCGDTGIRIGIITVPAPYAQPVCNTLIDSGITAVWNFAPTHLKVPSGIMVKNENMAASLAELSNHVGSNKVEG